MTDKVVMLQAVKREVDVDPELMLTIAELAQGVEALKCRAFAAVAVNDDGEVITTWYSTMTPVTLVGAIEILKSEFVDSNLKYEEDEYH